MNGILAKELLNAGGFWILNKSAVKIFGLEAAFLLTNLSEAETMLSDKKGWFYQTADTIEHITGLTRHKQDNAIQQLEEMGIISKDIRGLPAKRYFKINDKELSRQLVKELQTRVRKIDKLDCKKSATNKELSNKELSNKEKDIKIVKEKKSRELKFSDTHRKLADLLYGKVTENFPNTKKPNLDAWAEDIRLMMQQDNRTAKQIENAIEWSQQDSFWYANIRSASKLRKQYDSLNAQADRNGKSFDRSNNGTKNFFEKSDAKEKEFDFFN